MFDVPKFAKGKPPVQDTAVGLLAGGAALGLLASMWGKLKGVAWRAVGLFVQRVEIPTEAGHEAMIAYLISKHKRSRNYDRMYGASWEYQRDGRYGLVPYEQFGNRTLILWNGWVPFLFSNQVESKAASGKGTTDSSAGGTKVYSTITFVRGTVDAEASGTPGNISTITWDDTILSEQLIFDATAITHNFGFAVSRTADTTFVATKTLYTTTSAATAPSSSKFVLGGFLSRLDTQNVAEPRGRITAQMIGVKASIVKITA